MFAYPYPYAEMVYLLMFYYFTSKSAPTKSKR